MYAISDDGNTILWTYKTSAPIILPPLVASDAVYIVTNKGQVYALQLTGGALLWSYATHASTRSPLKMENGVITIYTNSGVTYRFSASSGNLLNVVEPLPEVTPTPEVTLLKRLRVLCEWIISF